MVIVESILFDALASPIIVGFIEFDVQQPVVALSDTDPVGGRGRPLRTSTSLKSSPAPHAHSYHGRSDEQDLIALAEQDDEESVIALLMEIAQHVV